MGIALYQAVRNPAWVKYSRLEEDTNAREILSEVSEVTQAVVVSVHGAISIPDIVRIIAEDRGIDSLDVTSLTVGIPAMDMLSDLHDNDRLGHVRFFLSSVMTNNDTNKKYGYLDKFTKICEEHGWEHIEINNHSKICLIRCTDGAVYTIETSANFNKNPKIEQFRIIGDMETYGFYREVLDSMATEGRKANVRSLESFGDDDRMSWGDCTF
jgi:hypothetical protein